MRPTDTSLEVRKKMDAHYRQMTPVEKAEAVRDAWRTARALALAGLRLDYPGESEEALEARWAERRLGTELYSRAVARLRELQRRSAKLSKQRSSLPESWIVSGLGT